jgi:hypothetical protein
MKYALSGTAIAAVLVIAAPVWAQTAAPMAPSSDQPMQHHVTHHRGHHHVVHHRGAGSSGNVANQLNAQEVARNSGGGMGGAPLPAGAGMGGAPAPEYGGPRNQYGQPNQVYGIPGAGQPSAGTPVPGAR